MQTKWNSRCTEIRENFSWKSATFFFYYNSFLILLGDLTYTKMGSSSSPTKFGNKEHTTTFLTFFRDKYWLVLVLEYLRVFVYIDTSEISSILWTISFDRTSCAKFVYRLTIDEVYVGIVFGKKVLLELFILFPTDVVMSSSKAPK